MSRVILRNSADLGLDTALKEINQSFEDIIQWASEQSGQIAPETEQGASSSSSSLGLSEQFDVVLLPSCVVITGELTSQAGKDIVVARIKNGIFTAVAWMNR